MRRILFTGNPNAAPKPCVRCGHGIAAGSYYYRTPRVADFTCEPCALPMFARTSPMPRHTSKCYACGVPTAELRQNRVGRWCCKPCLIAMSRAKCA